MPKAIPKHQAAIFRQADQFHGAGRAPLRPVAALAGLSPVRAGWRGAAFIRDRRLRYASRLRAGAGEPRRISEIAYACGFDSDAHFSRAFRRALRAGNDNQP